LAIIVKTTIEYRNQYQFCSLIINRRSYLFFISKVVSCPVEAEWAAPKASAAALLVVHLLIGFLVSSMHTTRYFTVELVNLLVELLADGLDLAFFLGIPFFLGALFLVRAIFFFGLLFFFGALFFLTVDFLEVAISV
jgi:hypothetical protein